MITNDETVTVKDLINKAVLYIETNINLVKLKLIHKGSSIVSAFLAYIIIAVFVLMLIIMLSIGASLWLGKILGATHYGFFITGGFFLLLIVIIYASKEKWLNIPITNSLLQNLRK